MKKKENSQHKIFNLDKDVIALIEQASNINGMTQSEFIEFLVNSWDESINPINRLKRLRKNKRSLGQEISELENKENEIMDSLQKLEEWRKFKQEKRPEVISNLVRIIKQGRTEDAEAIAKSQSIRLGVPAMTLILEAMNRARGEDGK